MADVDQLRLHFDPQSLVLLNAIMALVMFGVALDLRVQDFRRVIDTPRAPFIGLVCQFVALPALTYGLIILVRPAPSLALGMILVAACPGGNMSNFFTHLAGGNTALSVTMTAVSTTMALIMTPFNLTFWGHLHPRTSALLHEVDLNPMHVVLTVGAILVLPLFAGMTVARRAPALAARLRRPMRIFSIAVFASFIVIAFAANFDNFLTYIGQVFLIVMVHNGLALLTGYAAGRGLGLPVRDARAVSIEVGIQNAGLGLALIFDFFAGLGGMALVAAWWGVWHLITGLSLGLYWSRRPATD